MKKTHLLTYTSILCLALFVAASIDNDPISVLLKKLEAYTEKNPREKVHLHLDKPYYTVGDDIWFTAYVVDSRTGKPSAISNLLYVELIDAQNQVKNQLLLPVDSGITWSDFKLPDTLDEGNYRIRAYTNWMRNAGPDLFFDKTIKVGNGWANKVFTDASYTATTENGMPKLNGRIRFFGKDEKPFTGKTVNYKIMVNNKEIAQEKAVTDKNGEIVIPVQQSSAELSRYGNIIATIAISDKQKTTKVIPVRSVSKVDVQFLPEGGQMVNGLQSKVAIKSINESGLGEDIKGTIIDNNGTEVAAFETANLGMGSFMLTPVSGKTYQAKIKFKDAPEQMVNLPLAREKGYVLQVADVDTATIQVNIGVSAGLINKGELKLVGQQNGRILFINKLATDKALLSSSIKKMDLPSGITQLTLFSDDDLPYAERLVFVNNMHDKVAIDVKGLKKDYKTRSLVELTLSGANKGKPIASNYSVSVTNASVILPDTENETNIFASLLLTADLSGYIEKPNRYFADNTEATRKALDQLMLTQGWRNISWQALQNDKLTEPKYQPESMLQISGTLTEKGKPLAKTKIILRALIADSYRIDTVTDANGRFNFDRLDFDDGTKFVVRTAPGTKTTAKIELDPIPGHVFTTNKNSGDVEVNVNSSMFDYIKQSDKYFAQLVKTGYLQSSIGIEGVSIERVKVDRKGVPAYSANLNGPGNADEIVTAKELQSTFSLVGYLKGKGGMYFEKGQGYSGRSMVNLYNPSKGEGALKSPMLVVIDGNKADWGTLLDMQIRDIESIEILNAVPKTALYNYKSGVVVVTTKRGNANYSKDYFEEVPDKPDLGIITFFPKGISPTRQFYAPKYDTGGKPESDLRTTVHWAPHLTADAYGKGKLSFYNTDVAGNYRIVIEGIDVNGNLARKVMNYTVN